jgi:hypothetical protein
VLTDNRQEYFAAMATFLRSFQDFLHIYVEAERRQQAIDLRSRLAELQGLNKAADISLLTLKFIGNLFERSLTLIVNKSELITERSIGVLDDKSVGVCPAEKIKFQLPTDSVFQQVINSGELVFGPIRDQALEQQLFHEMGAPFESAKLLVPLRANGRTITLTYADFGNERTRPIPVDLIDFFFRQAGIAMGNTLFKKSPSPQR